MDIIRRWRSTIGRRLDLVNDYGMQDMVYAYKKGIPLVLSEMAMRQNTDDIGRFVRLADTNSASGPRPTWGAWLTLSVTSYIINIAPQAVIRLYNAWGELQAVGTGPNTSYLIRMAEEDMPNTLRSNTAVARVVVDVQNEEDGPRITLNSIIPLVNPYVVATSESQYRSIVIEPMDPQDLSGREYFALLNTLVAANPTKDIRIMRGLNYSDSAPNSVLDKVRIEALGLSPNDIGPRTKFGAQ